MTDDGDARALILVEGISDRIALRTTAAARGRDLDADRVRIEPIGGAHAIGRYLRDLGPAAARLRVVGLCDRQEQWTFRAHLPADRYFVCDRDLEEELIRAVGVACVEELFAAERDLDRFHLFRSQPAWRGRPIEAQMHRFVRSSSRRNLRYAHLLAAAAARRDTRPGPLAALLDAV
ncbi:hypothetical protein ACWT_4792 [Actinoplanes sp. SE50]|uniref:TOPRIM nucleotidyl transferase/hydrolase domain-containing protein n=1 Tax=unclassified Actinoplanes TaxID=2626549 RepID=UPI00023EC2ED|nr:MULTISPECIES: TOPRIM nucleotidyl transferase/hydrolase domain-containing protein [unclassified Actinoplanes]AEV85813.1 hypothetical protein ACPL_4922 [Actinoplanes sp. SE50/110]ATO84207.1 hypothetical protein ACWT_4792 [Actinoplanes sp. SE50]SLM01617.1 hypothetical protein ACSP50_4853 [Actinoplanes sp. SE50/110]